MRPRHWAASAKNQIPHAQKKRGRKCKTFSTSVRWAHLDLNQGPAGYESDALTD